MTKYQMISQMFCVCLLSNCLKTLELDNIFIELLIYKVMGLMSTLQHYIIVPGHHPQETLRCKRQTRRQQRWRRRVIETEVEQELTDEHSLDEELRCCVKECSPTDLCFVSPPSFFQPDQRVTKPAYVSIQQFRSTEVGIWRSNLDSCFLLLTVARLLSVATLVQQRHEQQYHRETWGEIKNVSCLFPLQGKVWSFIAHSDNLGLIYA